MRQITLSRLPTVKRRASQRPAVAEEESDPIEWSGGNYRGVILPRRKHSETRKRAVFVDD